MGEPPLKDGGDHVRTTKVFPGVASKFVGAPGIVAGVTLLEGAEAAESPTLFLATTVKVRGVPFATPVKVVVKTFPTVNA